MSEPAAAPAPPSEATPPPPLAAGHKEAAEIQERRAKVRALRAEGVNPYPDAFPDRTEIAAILAAHDPAALGAGTQDALAYRIAGRITARRGHGRTVFLDVRDRSGTLQAYARADGLSDARFRRLLSLDVGDVAGFEGRLHVTQRGQLALAVEEATLIAKALRPPPDKHHGVEQQELRYRHRELDLIANAGARELLLLRARVTWALREWMQAKGFIEVDPPLLEPVFGGASARPFVTRHQALGRDVYLRISSEVHLKRFIVGGMEKVYDLGRFFRNEGISPRHSPEFTMLEWMHSYIDYMELAEFVEQMVSTVAREALGTTTIRRDGRAIDLAPPWRRLSVRDGIRERTGVDVTDATPEQLSAALDG
ncbi:MAG TPA: amino acid--tRNA ligase-related protein, partial [Conexibacter sp.]|nr:amino acid--tRNA ligase-related protein [Conexibacter sp.]